MGEPAADLLGGQAALPSQIGGAGVVGEKDGADQLWAGIFLRGASIAFIRTRYAVAFYLIIFGYIIVAAYKMGMVHEKPRVVTRADLADGVEPAATPALEPGTVIEIREPGSDTNTRDFTARSDAARAERSQTAAQ